LPCITLKLLIRQQLVILLVINCSSTFLVIVQLDAQIPFNIFIYSSLHVSSLYLYVCVACFASHNLTFCWPCIMQWFLVIVQLDAQIPFNIFICASSWTITKNHCMMQVNKTLSSSTCFGCLYAHHQEVSLRFHCLWFSVLL